MKKKKSEQEEIVVEDGEREQEEVIVEEREQGEKVETGDYILVQFVEAGKKRTASTCCWKGDRRR